MRVHCKAHRASHISIYVISQMCIFLSPVRTLSQSVRFGHYRWPIYNIQWIKRNVHPIRVSPVEVCMAHQECSMNLPVHRLADSSELLPLFDKPASSCFPSSLLLPAPKHNRKHFCSHSGSHCKQQEQERREKRKEQLR